MNVQVLADPFGNLLWASPALSGAVHDARAARTHGVIDALTEAGIRCWADKGYRRPLACGPTRAVAPAVRRGCRPVRVVGECPV